MLEWIKNNPVLAALIGFSILGMLIGRKEHRELIKTLRRGK